MRKQREIDEATVRMLRNQENWLGSFYELGLAFASEQLDEQHHRQLLEEVWSTPSLQGVVSERRDLGKRWLPLEAVSTATAHHCYGCMHFNMVKSLAVAVALSRSNQSPGLFSMYLWECSNSSFRSAILSTSKITPGESRSMKSWLLLACVSIEHSHLR
jgi:hypothetical protein